VIIHPPIPPGLLDSLIRNGKDDSDARHIREKDAMEADYDATAVATADPTTSSEGPILGLRGDQLNNYFKHRCCEGAVRMLGAELRTLVEGDIGPCMLRMPGIHYGRFLPHQICCVWFIVERILSYRPPLALIADDMGLGKMHCAVATLLYLKHIVDGAAAGSPLTCLGAKSVEQFEEVLQIFGNAIEVYRPPSIIIVPANLVRAWERAVLNLIPKTGLTLINLFSECRLAHNDLNYCSDNPERGKAIHLISYSAYRTLYNNSEHWQGCNWGG